jgi:hypothetical protein
MGAATLIGLAFVAVSVIAALCFVAYLLLCRFIVNKTGDTEGLKDVATAMRAYKVPLPSRRSRSE